MLWMKGWLEIRWRFVWALAAVLATFGGALYNGQVSAKATAGVMALMPLLWLFGAVFLAGAGIRTQSPLQGTKGLHGSTQFTLSLPVSRLRLLSVRAVMGFTAVCGVIVISSGVAWFLFPMVRANAKAADFLSWVVAASCCAAAFHAVSIFNSTFLDEYWHVWLTVITIGFLKWLTVRFPPPASLDVFGVMGTRSPLVTHAVPWPAILLSLIFAGIVFFGAVWVAERIEY